MEETDRHSYELLLKERDDLQREAQTAHAELYAVLKQSDYRSSDELALDCMARMAIEAQQTPLQPVPTPPRCQPPAAAAPKWPPGRLRGGSGGGSWLCCWLCCWLANLIAAETQPARAAQLAVQLAAQLAGQRAIVDGVSLFAGDATSPRVSSSAEAIVRARGTAAPSAAASPPRRSNFASGGGLFSSASAADL